MPLRHLRFMQCRQLQCVCGGRSRCRPRGPGGGAHPGRGRAGRRMRGSLAPRLSRCGAKREREKERSGLAARSPPPDSTHGEAGVTVRIIAWLHCLWCTTSDNFPALRGQGAAAGATGRMTGRMTGCAGPEPRSGSLRGLSRWSGPGAWPPPARPGHRRRRRARQGQSGRSRD